MRLYKTFLSLALLSFLSVLLLSECRFKCNEFAPILVDVGLIDINTNTFMPVANRQLSLRMATEGQPAAEMPVRKNSTDFTVTVPTELFITDKVYQGTISVDNQWLTNIWIQFSREGRGCPNAGRISTLERSSLNATTLNLNDKWSISIRL
jgi:hypothetical protein